MVNLSVLATRITTNAAAVATAAAGGTTTAEAQSLGALLTVLALRPDLAQNALQLSTLAGANLNQA
jgi:hypothetical protein